MTGDKRRWTADGDSGVEAQASLRPEAVSIVVPAHADHDALIACFNGLRALAPPAGEVWVAIDGDNGDNGDNGAAVAARAQALGFHALPSPGRTGPAAARNRGAAAASGHVLFFVDSDIVVPPDAVQRVCTTLQDHQAAATFGSYDDRPADPGFVSQFTNLIHHHVHQTSSGRSETFWAGCGAVRTSWFERVGGFDESYDRPAIEDIELGYRLHAAGGTIIVDKALQAKHLKRWTLASMIRTHIVDRAWPWTQLILRRGQLDDNLNTDRKSRWAGGAAVVLALSLLLAIWRPQFLLLSAALAAVLLVVEHDLYRFFYRHRGARFALGAVGLHWLYLVYSSLTFGAGVLWSMLTRVLR